MASPGRNDPCPCGSGTKYKKCCLPRQQGIGLADDMSAREGAMAKLHHFAERPQFDTDREIAQVLFWGERIFAMPAGEAQALLDSEDAQVKFNTFFLFDLDIDGGRSVADMFLAAKDRQLSAAERGFLERMRRSHMALFEVVSVEPGASVHVRDLWTEMETVVTEHAGSRALARWDILGARVVPDSTGTPRFEGGLYLYSAGDKDAILGQFRQHHRRFMKHDPAADPAAFFRRHSMMFNHAWLDYVVQRPLPHMVTAERDEVVFSKSVFDVLDESLVRRTLADAADLDAHADGSFAWLEAGNDQRRVLGTWRFQGPRLVLETMSRQRAARGRVWLEGIAGKAVRHRATACETLASALTRGSPEAHHQEADQIPPEVSAEIVQKFQDRHYRAWLDAPVPALKNRTPRAAARSRTLRPQLIDLLKQFDNKTERARLSGRRAYDTRWLWQELGLTYPGTNP